VNVLLAVNEIDVLAAVALNLPINGAKDDRGSPGQFGEVVVHPLRYRTRAPEQLVNVPVGVNEIDVLAAVILRVPIECNQTGRGSPSQLG
jgi:hypothetical protein